MFLNDTLVCFCMLSVFFSGAWYQRKDVCKEALCGEGADEENVSSLLDNLSLRFFFRACIFHHVFVWRYSSRVSPCLMCL